MINLDQVRTLEWKVKQAVQLIVHLRRENDTLRGRLSDAEVRLQELDSLMESFKATQSEMESGIRNALEDLDHLEEGSSPAPAGPVAALTYPPVTETKVGEPEASEEVEEPAQAAVEEAVEAPVDVSVPEAAREPSFEEEYAALAAAEAEALARQASDGSERGEGEAALTPDSIELEDVAAAPEQDEESLFLETAAVTAPEPEPEPVVPEEKQPEQPGLGIF